MILLESVLCVLTTGTCPVELLAPWVYIYPIPLLRYITLPTLPAALSRARGTTALATRAWATPLFTRAPNEGRGKLKLNKLNLTQLNLYIYMYIYIYIYIYYKCIFNKVKPWFWTRVQLRQKRERSDHGHRADTTSSPILYNISEARLSCKYF